jgi:hypothetical protein
VPPAPPSTARDADHEALADIRHVRWLIWSWRVERHYAMWQQLGSLPVHRHLDEAVLDATVS